VRDRVATCGAGLTNEPPTPRSRRGVTWRGDVDRRGVAPPAGRSQLEDRRILDNDPDRLDEAASTAGAPSRAPGEHERENEGDLAQWRELSAQRACGNSPQSDPYCEAPRARASEHETGVAWCRKSTACRGGVRVLADRGGKEPGACRSTVSTANRIAGADSLACPKSDGCAGGLDARATAAVPRPVLQGAR